MEAFNVIPGTIRNSLMETGLTHHDNNNSNSYATNKAFMIFYLLNYHFEASFGIKTIARCRMLNTIPLKNIYKIRFTFHIIEIYLTLKKEAQVS